MKPSTLILFALSLCACSGAIAPESNGEQELARAVDRPDAGLTPCESQCEQIGALCETMCQGQSDSGAAAASCKNECAQAVQSKCLPYCPDSTP
jgi:hypothetical protein